MSVSARAAVLGKPIAHSLSPELHRAAYAALGLDWTYDKFEVDEVSLPSFLASASDFAGFSLTMPLKERAFEICVAPDAAAIATGACNTLVNTPSGWQGFNTDVPGFGSALQHANVQFDSALVLGGGATARSAVAALQAVGVAKIVVAARRVPQAVDLVARFGLPATSAQVLSPNLSSADLVVNTLPADAAADYKLHSSTKLLFDVVYAPWPTTLARQAVSNGVSLISGLELLVEQAVFQVGLMTRVSEAELAQAQLAMYATAERLRVERSN